MQKLVPQAFQPPHLHFTLIATVLFLISLYFFIKRLRATFEQLQRKWHPPAPYDPLLLKYDRNGAIFWGILLLLCALLMGLAIYLGSYQLLKNKAVLTGRIDWNGSSVRLVETEGRAVSGRVKGGRAAAAGIFLKFPGFLNYIGLYTYQRVLTFRGSSEFQYHYMQPDEDWLQQYVDPFVCSLYANRKWLKLLDVSYRESPYFGPGKHRLFATHSGYIVN